MADEPRPRSSLIDRRIRKIVNARSVTLGLAMTFVLLALAGAILIWLVDKHDFPNLGLAAWWSIETVTTVGYGDIVPTTVIGRIVGSVELVFGVSFIAFLTAGVTSTVIQSEEARSNEARRSQQNEDARAVLDALTATREAITALDTRLEAIELKLPAKPSY